MTVFQRHIRVLQRYAEGLGIRVERASLPACVLGRTCRDRITLHHGLAPSEELPTLIHELAHSLVHGAGESGHRCTLFEYEAEAVESLVMARIGVQERAGVTDPLHGFLETPTDGLLAESVSRVRFASERICEALERPHGSEAQAPVDLDATAGEEIVFENKPHGVGDFLGFAQPL